MKPNTLKTLNSKVKELCTDLLATKKENKRLTRLLLAAEAKVKKLTNTNGLGKNNILDMSKKIEKLKNERKIIKSKVEKMVTKLDNFYGE